MKVLLSCIFLLLAAPPAFTDKKGAVDAANAKSLSLVGKVAPAFSLPDFKQKTFNLTDQRGKVVVLAFWGTWCPPCRSEMPVLAKLQKETASEGVVIIPVAFDDPAKALDFLTKKKIDIWSLIDEGGAVASLYGARALPKTFIIDSDGVLVKAVIGKVSEAELRSVIQVARR